MPLPAIVPVAIGFAARWAIRRAIPVIWRWAVRWVPVALRWAWRNLGSAVRWGVRTGGAAVRWGVRAGGAALRWGVRTARSGIDWGLRAALGVLRFSLRLALSAIRFGLRMIPSLVRWGWRLLRTLPGITRMLGALGVIQDKISVKLTGGPRSNLKDLFRVGCAIAFSKVRRMVPAGAQLNPFPAPVKIGVHYALERRELEVVMIAEQSLTTIAITPIVGGIDKIDALPVFAGPSMTTTGEDWQFNFLAGLVTPTKTELTGKVLLTDSPTSPDPMTGVDGITKNHRPTGDARSRGTLVRMVTAALAAPVQEGPSTFLLPTDDNRFTGG